MHDVVIGITKTNTQTGPLVIQNEGLRVITCDTSYSNDTNWEAGRERVAPIVPSTAAGVSVGCGTRGHAVAEVCCSVEDGVLRDTIIHGVLSNGEDYSFALPPPNDTAGNRIGESVSSPRTPSFYIGREITDGWWARALLADGNILLTKAEGYKTVNRVRSQAWVHEQLENRLMNK